MKNIALLLSALTLASCDASKTKKEAQEPLKEISITEFYDGSDSERDLHFNITFKNEDHLYRNYTAKGMYKGKKMGFVVHIPKTTISNQRVQSGLVFESIDSLTKNLGDLLSSEFKHTLPPLVENKATLFYKVGEGDAYLYFLFYTNDWGRRDATLDIDTSKATIRFSIPLL